MRIAAILLGLGLLTAPALGGSGALCLKSSLGFLGVAPGQCFKHGEAGTLLAAKIDDGTGRPLSVTMASVSNPARTKEVTTCGDFLNALADGMTARGDVMRLFESCDAAMLLAAARPARKSFLGAWGADLSNPARVSASILPGRYAPDVTIKSLRASGELRVETPVEGDLELSVGGQRIAYREVARGDFNADDIEDSLILVTIQPLGSQPKRYAIVLSRYEAGGMLIRSDQKGG